MRWDDSVPPAENVRERLPKRFHKYIVVGNNAFEKKRSWTELHAFRIETKRIRYTLELFPEFFGPHYAELIDMVRRIQTLLGDANDLVNARRMLKGREGTEEVRQRFHDRARRKLAKARKFWLDEFGEEQAQRWERYLRTQARARPAA